jgi:hypothetical protein
MQATRHRLREGEGQCKNANSENTIWKSLPVTEGFAIRTTADAFIANQNRAIRVLNYPATLGGLSVLTSGYFLNKSQPTRIHRASSIQ